MTGTPAGGGSVRAGVTRPEHVHLGTVSHVHLGTISTAVAPLLHGPFRPARVVAATRYAVHLATGDRELPALAVVTRDAIRLPNALVLPFSSADRPLDLNAPWAGVGAGRVVIGPVRFEPEASWTPPRVQDASSPPDPARIRQLTVLLDALSQPLPPPLAPRLTDLRHALHTDKSSEVLRAARTLVGLGPGLTPSGDDILCGALLASRAWGGPLAPLSEAVADATLRTPLLSAALLRHAVRGECVPQAHAFLRSLRGDGALEPALRELLAVGHHSGGDLARGVLAVGLSRACAATGDRDDYPVNYPRLKPGLAARVITGDDEARLHPALTR
ncbi:DUF2877 domain-containing protein [Streptomyces sp. NBC_01445]|uniref:DUF2877 domain-containing protein n=1 Tax=Streptomyces sp. NBC_01445 TaxID=2903869 RepID=UPI002DDB7C08|nr:DUF2877 domain-containing protein [Streptomyces sp. NBC_01445]WSE09032.1 DUF2877 domain-containing protein [Streptomyces sp. NBC_01445]